MKIDQRDGQDGRDERRTAVVLKANLRDDSDLPAPREEIEELASTADIDIVGYLPQKLDRPHPATYLGKGKIEEAARLAGELDADFVIADNDLSPAQERNLERITSRTVLDRSQLIMDIFGRRAQTHQAKLQVELAQLRYSAPRLKRLWTHLSRYEGGIGVRGPGETQLETDKRLIGRRIQRIVRELKSIEKRHETSLTHREGEYVVALVGYTNAGKSTLLNSLTGSDELVEDKLFATLDTRVRRWPLGENQHVLLTDTVGFIRNLPHHLIASFHATLAETREADLLLHIVDASSPNAPWQIRTVQQVLREIGCTEQPTWLVLNKWDLVGDARLVEARHLAAVAEECGAVRGAPPEDRAFEISAQLGAGLDALREAVASHVRSGHLDLELDLPHSRGDVLGFLRRFATDVRTETRPHTLHVAFKISPARAGRLRRIYPEGFPG